MADTETAGPAEVSYDLRKLAQDGPEWYGCLTIENAEAVAARIQRVLSGHLYASALDWLDYGDIELHTSLKARDVEATVEDGHAMVSWSDGSGLHLWYTEVRDRAEGLKLSFEDRRRKGIWLHFYPDRVTADSFAPAGNRNRSTFRIEHPEHLSDDYA